jgi:hypothetical protein
MKKFATVTVLVLLGLLICGLAQRVPEMDVNTDKIPKTKLGEMYHKTASKVDEVLGAKANQRKHDLLVKEKQIKDKVEDVTDSVKLKTQDAFDSLKSAFNSQSLKDSASGKFQAAKEKARSALDSEKESVDEIKLKAEDYLEKGKRRLSDVKEKASAGVNSVPKTKVGEIFHKTAAKTDELLGDKVNQRKHENLVKEKQIKDQVNGMVGNAKNSFHEGLDRVKDSTGSVKDSISDKVHQIRENAHRAIPSEKLRREDFLEKGRRKLEDMKESATFSKMPETKFGELYHQAAGKVDGILGDEVGKHSHETIVKEKQMKDKITAAAQTVKAKAQEAYDSIQQTAASATGAQIPRTGKKTTISEAAEQVKQEGQQHLKSVKDKLADIKQRTSAAFDAAKNRGGEAAAKVKQELHEVKDKLQGR